MMKPPQLVQSYADVIEFLGPVIEHFVRRLDQHISYLDDGDTAFLFATRAGIRIRRLLEIYAKKLGREASARGGILFSSRLLVCKGTSSLQPRNAMDVIGSEHAHLALRDTLAAVYASRPEDERKRALAFEFGHQPLHEFFTSDYPGAAELRRYMGEQSRLFQAHLEQITRSTRRIVLIDSGWQGTSQRLLAEAFPDRQWHGLYFGWMAARDDWNMGRWGTATGLIFDSPGYVRNRPETAIAAHRHLIESLLEVNAPSIEELREDGREPGRITAVAAEAAMRDAFTDASDPLYAELLRYFEVLRPQKAACRVAVFQQAIRVLEEKILSPHRSEVKFIEGKRRSADFGRDLLVPVILDDDCTGLPRTPAERIAHSLWPEGQIALEYPMDKARRIQRTRRNRAMASIPERSADVWQEAAGSGRVAIITRTKDRPVLLKRAAQSVANQTYTNYVWVVINDGGDPEPVLEIIGACHVPGHQITFCSNASSVGMEAASNIGIRASSSEFIVIHDDDDAWHTEFLEKTVRFLSGADGAKYGGVISHSIYVSEEVAGDTVREWGRWPYQDWVQNVQLSELVVENFYPPIAFLFRRDVCERIGLFDEKFPVLGDWDFNIRFLMEADIGVLPEHLAYYHHRDRGNAGTYSNSVVGGVSKHIEYSAILRNKFIRDNSENPKWRQVASLLAGGYAHRDIRDRLRSLAGSGARQAGVQVGPATASPPRPEEISIADYRWCLLQAYRHSNKDIFKRIARLLWGFPSNEAKLSKLIRGTPLTPPPDFDEQAYLGSNADVRAAVQQGRFTSGFEHYIKYGKAERRGRPQKM